MADMLVKLYALPDSRPIVDELRGRGIDIRRALAPEKHRIVEWVRERFSDGWASETDICFSRRPISCFIAVEGTSVLAFACHDGVCRNFFGPTGVDPKHRKSGIGKALLLACLESMRADGYGYAIIGGVGPADYYARTVGAELIADSEPGVYRGLLRGPKARRS